MFDASCEMNGVPSHGTQLTSHDAVIKPADLLIWCENVCGCHIPHQRGASENIEARHFVAAFPFRNLPLDGVEKHRSKTSVRVEPPSSGVHRENLLHTEGPMYKVEGCARP